MPTARQSTTLTGPERKKESDAIMPFVFFVHAIVPGQYVAYAAVTVLSGVAAGAVGIGGVLLTPTLILMGVPARDATYAVVSSMFPVAAIYATQRLREGPDGLHRRAAAAMCVGALPGAIAGGLLLPVVSQLVITFTVNSIALLSGLHTLVAQLRKIKRGTAAGQTRAEKKETTATISSKEGGTVDADGVRLDDGDLDKGESSVPSRNITRKRDADVVAFMARFQTVREQLPLFAIGLVGGFFSVMTSSGGPFCMIPLLFMAYGSKIPAHSSVALTWTAGIVVCATLAVVASVSSEVDLGLGLVTCVSMQAGIPFGVRLGKKANKDMLRSLIGAILLVLGVYSFVNIGMILHSATDGGDSDGTNSTLPSPL